MTETKRRNFLKTTASAAALGVLIKTRKASANDMIRIGVVGIRSRGNGHVNSLANLYGMNVDITALCDIDDNVLQRRKAEYLEDEKVNPDVKTFHDFREMLEGDTVDAVSIATPNHWHSLQGIWACQAGKDVYVEKPLSHNIYEGRKLVEAARKYDRVVQHGTQIRSSAAIREAMDYLHSGELGEVYHAKGICYRWRNTIGQEPVTDVPDGVNYDLWMGPAPEKPFTDNRFHYDWHWQWDYGNGDIGNQGVHQMDVCRWGLNVGLPDTATSIGGHFMFEDDQETPNTMHAGMKYKDENKLLTFEVRHWITNDELIDGSRVGCIFFGSKGIMIIPSYNKYQVYLGRDREPGPGRSEGGDHFANFINVMRSRNLSELHADVEEGHLSSALCHIANAAYMTEDHLQIDREKETCTNNQQADDILQGRARGFRSPFEIPDTI